MSPTLRTILSAGAVAAVLDISGAFVLAGTSGTDPVQVLQSVASGWLGRDAYTGGAATALLGAATHVMIAMTFATVFVLAARRIRWLVEHPLIAGPLYGLLAWAVMFQVVLPLRWPQLWLRFSWRGTLGQLFCHLVLVGLSIALVTRRGLRSSATT